MSTQNVNHQIIVLGNGFDLACDLPSTYHDFFEWRVKQIDPSIPTNSNSEFQECLESPVISRTQGIDPDPIVSLLEGCNKAEGFLNHLVLSLRNSNSKNMAFYLPQDQQDIKTFNFWDLIFLLYNKIGDKNWFDVENTMESFLNDIFNIKDSQINPSSDNRHKLLYLLFEAEEKSYEMIQSFLIKQLNLFEINFAKYIKEVVDGDGNKNLDFINKAKDKLNYILNAYKATNMEATILSFNYSLCEQDELKNHFSNTIKQWINIHGYADYSSNSLEYPPIFGIDSSNIKHTPNFLDVFTKTYQIAFNNIDRDNLELPKNAYCISFYGHSLAPADYSYFESLFDMYDLYSSDIYLCFYCGLYSPNDIPKENKKNSDNSLDKNAFLQKINAENNKIKQEMITSIYNLINHYGKSLSNNHGDNLLHRLLLEGRLKVELDCGARKH